MVEISNVMYVIEKATSQKKYTKRYIHDVFRQARSHNNFTGCGIAICLQV